MVRFVELRQRAKQGKMSTTGQVRSVSFLGAKVLDFVKVQWDAGCPASKVGSTMGRAASLQFVPWFAPLGALFGVPFSDAAASARGGRGRPFGRAAPAGVAAGRRALRGRCFAAADVFRGDDAASDAARWGGSGRRKRAGSGQPLPSAAASTAAAVQPTAAAAAI